MSASEWLGHIGLWFIGGWIVLFFGLDLLRDLRDQKRKARKKEKKRLKKLALATPQTGSPSA